MPSPPALLGDAKMPGAFSSRPCPLKHANAGKCDGGRCKAQLAASAVTLCALCVLSCEFLYIFTSDCVCAHALTSVHACVHMWTSICACSVYQGAMYICFVIGMRLCPCAYSCVRAHACPFVSACWTAHAPPVPALVVSSRARPRKQSDCVCFDSCMRECARAHVRGCIHHGVCFVLVLAAVLAARRIPGRGRWPCRRALAAASMRTTTLTNPRRARRPPNMAARTGGRTD
eukprot:4802893-Pleurochrysis_carterae.AAC.1